MKCVEYCDAALEVDPLSAVAWSKRGDCVSRLGMDGSRDPDGSYNTDTSRRRNGNRTVGGKLSKGEERLERKRALYAVQHFDRALHLDLSNLSSACNSRHTHVDKHNKQNLKIAGDTEKHDRGSAYRTKPGTWGGNPTDGNGRTTEAHTGDRVIVKSENCDGRQASNQKRLNYNALAFQSWNRLGHKLAKGAVRECHNYPQVGLLKKGYSGAGEGASNQEEGNNTQQDTDGQDEDPTKFRLEIRGIDF